VHLCSTALLVAFLPLWSYLHLAISEMWCWSWGRGILTDCLYATILCNIIMVHDGMSSSYRSVNFIWLCSLSSEHLCIFGRHGAMYIFLKIFVTFFTLTFRELSMVGLALDLGHCPSVLWCCWVSWPVKSSPKLPILSRGPSLPLSFSAMMLLGYLTSK